MLLRSIIFSGAIEGLFLILLLKTKRNSSQSDRLLMLWMFILTLQLGFYYDNLAATPVLPNYLQLVVFSLPLISSPIFYLYICSLSLGAGFKWKNTSTHLLSFLIFNVITFFVYSTGENNIFFKDGLPNFDNTLNPAVKYFLTTLLAIIPGGYSVLSLLVLLRHQKRLPDNYSYTEKINLDWLKWIVVSLLILFAGLFLFIKYGVNVGLVSYPNLFAVVGAILTIYVFFIGFCGLHQDAVSDHPIQEYFITETIAATNYKNSGLSDEKAGQIFTRLRLHMEHEKPFLREDLTLTELAKDMQVTANQLSQVINQKAGSNFFNFVNGYRIATVKEKFQDPSMAAYSVLGIAYDSGFRSKSSFNKIFKETTGQTPLQYRNAIS